MYSMISREMQSEEIVALATIEGPVWWGAQMIGQLRWMQSFLSHFYVSGQAGAA